MQQAPLICNKAWLNSLTDSITLEVSHEPTPWDLSAMRTSLRTFFLEENVWFFLSTQGNRVLLQLTPKSVQEVEVDEEFVREVLCAMNCDGAVPIRHKMMNKDILNQGMMTRHTRIPENYFQAGA